MLSQWLGNMFFLLKCSLYIRLYLNKIIYMLSCEEITAISQEEDFNGFKSKISEEVKLLCSMKLSRMKDRK